MRNKPLALAGGLLAFAAVAGGIIVLLSQNAGKSQSMTADRGAPKKQDVGPPSQPGSSLPLPETAPASESLAKLRGSFELKDFSETVRLADDILSADPGNAVAREFRIKAKAGLDSALVASRLQTGRANLESGNYGACVRDMEEILRLDENNQSARDYLYKADTALSKRDIVAMIERRRQAEESKDLEGLLKGLASETLASQEQSYYSMIFTIYDGIKSKIQDNTVSVSFSDRTHATASFHHALQGISKKDGKQKPILYAQKQWTLEKRGKAWNIVRIQEGS
jgi:hypothetical protein